VRVIRRKVARVTVNPSPQSSPLRKGRGGIIHAEKMLNQRSLGSGLPLPANSHGFAHEIRIPHYFRRILRSWIAPLEQ
jgi:hypothetical protein